MTHASTKLRTRRSPICLYLVQISANKDIVGAIVWDVMVGVSKLSLQVLLVCRVWWWPAGEDDLQYPEDGKQAEGGGVEPHHHQAAAAPAQPSQHSPLHLLEL